MILNLFLILMLLLLGVPIVFLSGLIIVAGWLLVIAVCFDIHTWFCERYLNGKKK